MHDKKRVTDEPVLRSGRAFGVRREVEGQQSLKRTKNYI